MTAQEKLDAIMGLLTDKNQGQAKAEGLFNNDDEAFGGLLMIGRTFTKATEIYNA